MKIISMYLPQFHVIPENSEWWGEGFTEWVNTKKAVSYYQGHQQPKIPLDENYYNLLDPEVLRWQAGLAREYSVDAFAFYHYWFEKGRKVLEKPAEILLNHSDIKLDFCFAWANEDWTKTWHGAKGQKEVLMKESYGDEVDWKEHFDYLLSFFLDDRYIKIDNKPLFLIYRLEHLLENAKEMLTFWNKWAKACGFDGVYFVAMDSKRTRQEKKLIASEENILASVDFVPGYVRDEIRNSKDWSRVFKRYLNKYLPYINFWNKWACLSFDYIEFNEKLLNLPHKKNEWRNCLVDYDDTPRRGKQGLITLNSSPERFEYYLAETLKKSISEGHDFCFITAWNEWGEGNHLEPDEHYRYGWLEAVRNAVKKGLC